MWRCILAGLLAAADPVANDLAPPVPLCAGGQAINVDMGHAAPFVADLKGDGQRQRLCSLVIDPVRRACVAGRAG